MTRLRRRAGQEDGQSLVFFVVGMTAFVLMVALVVDVGMWFQAQRKTQSVADAAALAGAQQLPYSTARASLSAYDYAQLNSPATTLETPTFPTANSIAVTASVKLPGFFSGLAGIAGVTAKAQATAGVGPAAALSNDQLAAAGDTVITPLVVSRGLTLCMPGCLDGPDQQLVFGSGLGVMCPGGCANNGRSGGAQLADWIQCPRCLTGTYGPGDDTNGSGTTSVKDAPPRAVASGQFTSALRSLEGKTVIVPVFDRDDGSSYRIVGLAALFVRRVSWNAGRNSTKSIWGHFTTYQAPGALSPGGTAANYGVSVIGLTT